MIERPLRIAFLLPSFPAISTTFILTQITGLLDRGHNVDLFAVRLTRPETVHADVARYELYSRQQHIPIPKNKWRRLGSAVRLLSRREHLLHPAMLDAVNPLKHGREAWALGRVHTTASFLRCEPYDILHCQFGGHGPLAERLISRGAVRAKLVTSFRGNDLTASVAARPHRFKDLFRNGHLFMPVSQNFRDRLMAYGVPPERIVVHHSGIDVRRFTFSARQAPQGPVELLLVGRLTEKKGHVYALEALAKVIETGRDARLTLIGDGELRGALRERCSDLGIGNRVVFRGSCSQEEVISVMQSSHLLLAPSVTAATGGQEGIPNVLKEAMATGMPVVSTFHSGIPELVLHGISGLLVPERDSDAIASSLISLLDHPEHWPAMGLAARRKVEAEFDSERLNDALVAAYRALATDAIRADH